MGSYYQVVAFFLLFFVGPFLLGSIPWGLIVSKLLYRIDIREHGSGNIGTTNAMRALGKTGGALVFLLDFSKGVLAAVLGIIIWYFAFTVIAANASMAGSDSLASTISLVETFRLSLFGEVSSFGLQSALATSFMGCVLGHIFSPWLKLKGGKGIAVAIGCVLFCYGLLGFALELGIFIVLVLTTRRVSIGSIAAGIACPFVGAWLFWGNVYAITICALVGIFVVWAHRGNIKRLMNGTEPKIGDKKKLEGSFDLEEPKKLGQEEK